MSFLLVALNLAGCLAFFLSRAPDREFYQRRRVMEATHEFQVASYDPLHFADRPVYGSGFHGPEEAWWLRTLLVLNIPALLLTSITEDHFALQLATAHPSWSARCLDFPSWFRAFGFVVFSSLQWFLLGLAVSWLVLRRSSAAA